jgi:DNA replication protein DnaC
MKEFSEGRVLSRIKEMCKIMELSGADYREKK